MDITEINSEEEFMQELRIRPKQTLEKILFDEVIIDPSIFTYIIEYIPYCIEHDYKKYKYIIIEILFFALRHQKEYVREGAIYAIEYLSIFDEEDDIYVKILKNENNYKYHNSKTVKNLLQAYK
jgi:hypothetical protein